MDIQIKPGTLAYANNNPGNLRFAGQAGASQGEGGFARFDSPQAGYDALHSQIQLDASRGLDLNSFISKYAPPSENDTSTYIKQASSSLGVDPSVKLASLNSHQLAKFMAQKESSTVVKDGQTNNSFADLIDQLRGKGGSDTKILNYLSTKVPQSQKVISDLRQKAQTSGKNDRDIVNYLSQKFSGKLPSKPSNPLEPDAVKANIQAKQTQNKSVFGFVGNVITSTAEAAKGIYQAIRHPIQTVSNVGQMLEGFVQNAAAQPLKVATEAVTGGKMTLDTTKKTEAQQKADAVWNFYKQRYGGWQNVKDTVYNDPVGFALDATVLLDAGASALGKVGELSKVESLSKAANILQKAADTTNVFKIPGKISGSIVGKISENLAKSKDAEAIDAAEKAGVKLPIQATTKSETLRKTVQTVERGVFGGKLQDVSEAAQAKLESNIEEIQKSITPEEISKEGIGGKVQEAYAKAEKAFKEQSEKLYDEVSKQSKYRVASTENTQTVLNDIINQEKQALGAGNQSTINKMTRILNSLSGDVQFDNLRSMRTVIGKEIASDPTNPYLRRLYGGLSSDLDATAKASAPELVKSFEEATKFYRENIRQLRSSVGVSIKRSLPENIAKNFAKPNNATNLRLLRTIVGDDAMEYIGSSYLADLVKKSTDFTGEFNLKKFLKESSRMDQNTLQELLSPEQLQNLDKAKKASSVNQIVQEALKQGQKGGKLLRNEINIGELGLSLSHPLMVVKAIMGEYGMAKFILSPTGRKFLMGEGVTRGMMSKLLEQANKIAPYAAVSGRSQ